MDKHQYRRQIVNKKFESLDRLDWISRVLIVLGIVCVILFLLVPFNL